VVPYTSLGEDEALGIVGLLRISNNKALSILEQARFIDDLKNLHGLNATAIAAELGRSKSWVSMRLGLIGEMSGAVREKIFSGAFPVYPYMYTLRQFMRMNSVSKKDVEEFVVALSGKELSVREIERLARGYFEGQAASLDECLVAVEPRQEGTLDELIAVTSAVVGLEPWEFEEQPKRRKCALARQLIVWLWVKRFAGRQIDVARKLNTSTAAVSKWYGRAVQKRVELDALAEKVLSKMPSMLSAKSPKTTIVYGFKHTL